MSPPGREPDTLAGGSTNPVNATDRTGPSPRELIIRAAQSAMIASGEDVSPRKVNRICQRFWVALSRNNISFHQFLVSETARNRVYGFDHGLRCLRGYLDPTGVRAVNHVMSERGF